MVIDGVSTNRVEKIVEKLSPDLAFSKSTVSRITQELYPQIKKWQEERLRKHMSDFKWDPEKLEKEGIKFARYADDTIAWSPEYSKICNSFGHINEFSTDAGVKINPSKSDGISLLTKEGLPAEISAKNSLDFLGYTLSVENVSIKDKSVKKFKNKFLIYSIET